MKDTEIWKPVLNFEGLYEVSNLGRVKSLYTGNIRKPYIQSRGYLTVNLKKEKYYNKRLNRLVYEAFNGPIPPDYDINHINEEKSDNRLCNLNLMTRKNNINWGTGVDRRAFKQRSSQKGRKPVLQFDLNDVFIQEFQSIHEAARSIDSKKAASIASQISNCLHGRVKHACKYNWKYKNV